MTYLALDINGNIHSLGDCKNFDEAEHKTCPLGEIPAVWIWNEEDARKAVETINQKLPMNKKYVVEMMIGYEFEVAFHLVDDDTRSNGGRKPLRFDSAEEAQKELDDCNESCEEAVKMGNMDTSFREDEYNIREATEEEIQ